MKRSNFFIGYCVVLALMFYVIIPIDYPKKDMWYILAAYLFTQYFVYLGTHEKP